MAVHSAWTMVLRNYMINIKRIFKDNRLMRATTGLSIKGFDSLAPKFSKALYEIQFQQYEEGIRAGTRQRKPGAGAKGRLKTMQLKLFFILMYFKAYPTMDVMGLFFDLDRANVKHQIDNLTPILESALGKTLSLPKRKIRSLQEFFELIPEAKDLFIDGTERPVQRPKDQKKQKQNYSGKKKAHTKKNLVISDEKNKIQYLGPTREGKAHDYGMFKDEFDPSTIPRKIAIWVDKGFQGITKDYPEADVVMPKRKPKGKELTEYDKEQNKIISGIRILSEHAIGGVKRLRIVADKFRNKTEKFNDQVMHISCGLWNYQLEYC